MAEEITLLAHLVPRITNRIEDTATDALAFILNKSERCSEAFNDLLQDGGFGLEPVTRFQTQVTYEDGSRPDMNGYDKSGAKRLLVESKFWATLLQGQASDYLDQLDKEGPGVLLFITPESRLVTIWAEIERQMRDAGKEIEPVDSQSNIRKARIADSDKGLMLVSWDQLLRRLSDAVGGDTQVASDIQQLGGLARRQDDEAFLPIRPEELAPLLPRRIRLMNRLIDDAIRKGRREIGITTEGLRRAPQIQGYGRYFRFREVPGDLFLCVNYRLWSTEADTPLWLWISRQVPVNVDMLRDKFPSTVGNDGNGPYDVPIHLKTGVEHQAVLDDVIRQIKEIKESVNGNS